MGKDSVVLLGCGDVGPMEDPIDRFSELIRPVLATGDIRFAQCERLYSERGSLRPHGYPHCRIKPHMSSVFSDCGFDVVSLASNHGGDWGEEALVDTIAIFRKKGIPTIGAGRDLKEARKPVIIERNGVRIAFLGYCSVLREGYDARHDKAGIAPLRAYTYYESRDFNPGVPPRVVSAPYQQDLEAMLEDVAAARKLADSVVLSMHWGVHYYQQIVAEYQPIIAHAAIDAGVDLILGHHPHLLKAIEVYKGKVRFKELTEGTITDEQRMVYREICTGPRGHLGPPSSVILHSPGLARHTHKAGEYIRYGSPLRGRVMEFVILIAARYWSSQNAWHAHYPLAIKAGLSPEVASELALGRRPSGMKEDEAAAYDFCTELTHNKEVSDAVFDTAIRRFGEIGVVDLMGASAYYTLQCMALKVNQVSVPEGTLLPLPPLN